MSEDPPSLTAAPSGSADQAPKRYAPSALQVAVLRHEPQWAAAGVSQAALTAAAKAAFLAGAEPARGTEAQEITLVLSNDPEIRTLNRDWRGKDAATNVLSFPAGDGLGGQDGPVPLGDVVLAFETVEREAAEQAISLQDHAIHLVVHGVLHLLGFDHMTEQDAAEMEGLETEILAGLGIADPYGEPAASLTSGAAR